MNNKVVYNPEERVFQKKIETQKHGEPLAVVYARVSSHRQEKEGNGLESQENKCREWCKKNDIPVTKAYKDGSVSGAKIDREALDDAIEYVKQQNRKYTKVTHFVVTETSRLARPGDLEDTLRAIQKKSQLESMGVEVVTVNENMDTKTDEGKLLEIIQFGIAGYERKKITKRAHDGRRNRLLQGRRPFPAPPVGYTRHKTGNDYQDIVDTEKSDIIKNGLEMYANDVLISNGDLFEYRKEQGLTTSYDKKGQKKLWATFIEKTMQPHRLFFYAGMIFYPKRDIIEPVDGRHTGIISLGTVHKILTKINTSSKGKGKKPRKSDVTKDFIMKGTITCPGCERKFSGWFSKSHTGDKYPYYGCSNKNCKQRSNIPKDQLESEFRLFLSAIKTPKEIINLFKSILKEQRALKKDSHNGENTSKHREINSNKHRMKEIMLCLPKTKNNELYNELEEERSELNELNKQLETEIENKKYTENEFSDLLEKTSGIIESPLAFRELGSVQIRQLLIGVRFGGNVYYSNTKGYRTNTKHGLYYIISNILDDNSVNGVRWDLNPRPSA